MQLEAGLAVQAKGLRVSFLGREVLRGVDFSAQANAITVLLGRSGSGKTTLLRSMNRLNEQFPGCATSGGLRLRLGGRDLDPYSGELPVQDLRRAVGMVFQTPNALPLSIARNLELPLLHAAGLSRAQAAERAEAALREARLWDEVKDRLHTPALSLSGGQQQRLCLARALALDPEILLLDEPTASLDFLAAAAIEDLLRQLTSRYTLVLVSHSLGAAARLADAALVLRDGAVSAALAPGELRALAQDRRLADLF